MLKLLKTTLTSNRKRRCRAVSATIWLLRIIYDIETAEMNRFSNMLDEFDFTPGIVSKREYALTEEECINSECALGFLECAITDLGYAY